MALVLSVLAAATFLMLFLLLRRSERKDAPPTETPKQTGAGRRVWSSLLLAGPGVALALYLYVPVMARYPDAPRLMLLFSPDFTLQTELLQTMRQEGRFDLGIPRRAEDPATTYRFPYGSLHMNLSMALSRPVAWLGFHSFSAIAKTQGGLFLLALCGCLVLVAWWGRFIGGWVCGLIAPLVYMFPYKVMHATVHACSPDHLQQVLVLGCLTACAVLLDRPSRHLVLLAAFLAGMALGTKFLGLLLVPVIGGVYLARVRPRWQDLRAADFEGLLCWGTLGLALGFVTASPQAAQYPSYFIERVSTLGEALTHTQQFSDLGVIGAYKALWWQSFIRYDVVLMVLVGAGLLLLGLRLVLPRQDAVRRSYVIVAWVWLAWFAMVLLGRVRYFEPGVFLPLWPVLSIAAALPAAAAAYGLPRLVRLRGPVWQAAVAVPVGIGLLAFEMSGRQTALGPVLVDRPLLFNAAHPFYKGVMDLAAFLEQHYDADTGILADCAPVYVPSRFQKVCLTSPVMLNRVPPEELGETRVFILAHREKDLDDAILAGRGGDDAAKSKPIYEQIRHGGGFAKVAQFDYPSGWLTGPVEVWERTTQVSPAPPAPGPASPGHSPASPWRRPAVEFLPGESSEFHGRPHRVEDLLAGQSPYAAALVSAPMPQRIALRALSPIGRISLGVYTATDYPEAIALEVLQSDQWAPLPIARLDGSATGLRLSLAEPVPPRTVFRIRFDRFVGAQRILLREMEFDAAAAGGGPPQFPSGKVDLRQVYGHAPFAPTWYQCGRAIEGLDRRLRELLDAPELSPARRAEARQHVAELTGAGPSAPEATVSPIESHGAMQTCDVRLQDGRSIHLLVRPREKPECVVVFLPGTGERGADAMKYLPLGGPPLAGLAVVVAELSPVMPGQDLAFHWNCPALGERTAIAVLDEDARAAVRAARQLYPGSAVVLAGYSLGAQVALLAGDQADAVLSLMPASYAHVLEEQASVGTGFEVYTTRGADRDVFVEGLLAIEGPVTVLSNLAGDSFARLKDARALPEYRFVPTDQPHGPFRSEWMDLLNDLLRRHREGRPAADRTAPPPESAP